MFASGKFAAEGEDRMELADVVNIEIFNILMKVSDWEPAVKFVQRYLGTLIEYDKINGT